uniref:Uncharacterized protein n=1 Tax=Rhizophora mucronata TaxID=61149 RepID=A0A2P2JYF5_RHIMU
MITLNLSKLRESFINKEPQTQPTQCVWHLKISTSLPNGVQFGQVSKELANNYVQK